MPLSISSAGRQLSDGNTVGTTLGLASNSAGLPDQISFYGATPQPQTSGNAQAAMARGQQCGVVATYFTLQTPSRVGATSSLESSFTTIISGLATMIPQAGDLCYINKPTAQAGIGVGNIRVSGTNNLAVTFNNFGATSISPTAGENYRVVALRGLVSSLVTISPVSVASSTTAEQLFSVPGLRVNELVQVMKPSAQGGLDIVGCRVAAAGQVGITFANVSTSAITPTASEGYTVWSLGGLDVNSNEIYVQELFTPANSIVTVKELSMTVTGLATTDAILGVTKPTADPTCLLGSARVSAAGVAALSFGNTSTTAVTPAASETYGLKLYRPNPVAPLVVYSAALAPVSVAANTTAEQSFTVTGLVVNSPVWVNKPSFTTGLGIVGCRTSAANQLFITYCNATSAAITPPAETYLVGNFQIGGIDSQSSWVQTASPQQDQAARLLVAIRAALAANGMIAGA